MGPVKASKTRNRQHNLAKTVHEESDFTILPCDQKLTEDMTKRDSAHKFGTASTAHFKTKMS